MIRSVSDRASKALADSCAALAGELGEDAPVLLSGPDAHRLNAAWSRLGEAARARVARFAEALTKVDDQ